MRVAPHELGDDPLDFDFIGGVVFRRKRVMREHLTAAREQGDTGDEHHNRAFHERVSFIISSGCYMPPRQTYRSSTGRWSCRTARRNRGSAGPPLLGPASSRS